MRLPSALAFSLLFVFILAFIEADGRDRLKYAAGMILVPLISGWYGSWIMRRRRRKSSR